MPLGFLRLKILLIYVCYLPMANVLTILATSKSGLDAFNHFPWYTHLSTVVQLLDS